MKKILLLILAILLLTSTMTGCNIGKKLQEKAGEELVEDILGSNVDLVCEKVLFGGYYGDKFDFVVIELLDSELARVIPKYPSGTVESGIQSSNVVQVSISGTNERDFKAYLELIKDIFSENAYEGTSDGSTTYSASDGKGHSILIIYDDESCSISLGKDS